MTKKQRLWEKRVREWKESGQSFREFCKDKSFSDGSLRRWAVLFGEIPSFRKRRSLTENSSREVDALRLARVVLTEEGQRDSISSSFADHCDSGVQLQAAGVVISVKRGFDATTLNLLFDVLDARRCRQ